jgi:hypothetical protein
MVGTAEKKVNSSRDEFYSAGCWVPSRKLRAAPFYYRRRFLTKQLTGLRVQ